MSPKIIPKEQLEAYQRWELPSVGYPPEEAPPAEVEVEEEAPQMRLPTAEEIEAIQRQAYDEAFAQGYQEGMAQAQTQVQAQARAQLQAQTRRLDELMMGLSRPFEVLDQEVEQELVTLVIALVRQLVRRELKADPGQIVAVVREAMAALPVAGRKVSLHLHPEDAALVREALSLSDAERPWHIVEDPVQTRGGCRVSTEVSYVDASLETRLAALIANVFGGERAGDMARTPPET